jgi:predicted HAD superfamily Cof-like phosphohydrolase
MNRLCGTVVSMASGEAGIRGRRFCRDKPQANALEDTTPTAALRGEADATSPVAPGLERDTRTDDTADADYDSARRLSEAMLSVARFHQAFNLPRATRPDAGIPDVLARLRVDLLVEEVGEFADATAQRDLVGIADALADIVYVAYGAAVTYGINLDAALHEVHRSNMSKLDENGKPVYREDGKVLKSARYTPPDIRAVLSAQPPLTF